jgi:hypothetical protein
MICYHRRQSKQSREIKHDWFAEVKGSVLLHTPASSAQSQHWHVALDADESTTALPRMTLYKSHGAGALHRLFAGLDDDAWCCYIQEPVEVTARFFAAFTRARLRVIFTHSPERGQ